VTFFCFMQDGHEVHYVKPFYSFSCGMLFFWSIEIGVCMFVISSLFFCLFVSYIMWHFLFYAGLPWSPLCKTFLFIFLWHVVFLARWNWSMYDRYFKPKSLINWVIWLYKLVYFIEIHNITLMIMEHDRSWKCQVPWGSVWHVSLYCVSVWA